MVKNKFNISICVPAFNEEVSLRGAVEDLLTTLSPIVNELEVIIVNDGSTDSTLHLAGQLSREYDKIKVIDHKRKLGIGFCYRDALAIAKGDYFTWFPSDQENSAEEFIQCFSYLGNRKIVTCHHRGRDPRSAIRLKLSWGYTWILNKCFHLDLKYYNGLTIFPVSLLRSIPLVANGFAFPAESLIRAIQSGYQVVELSSPLRKGTSGKSSSLSFSSFLQIVIDIFHIFIKSQQTKI